MNPFREPQQFIPSQINQEISLAIRTRNSHERHKHKWIETNLHISDNGERSPERARCFGSVRRAGCVPATLFIDVDMSACREMKREFEARGQELTETAILLKAVALAQRKHPRSKAYSLPFLRLVTPEKIVAGFTVERDVYGEPAVFFGTIASPETKSLGEIMAELKQYVQLPISEHPVLREQLRFTRLPKLARQLILLAGAWFPPVRLRFMPATFGLTSLGKFGIEELFGPTVCTSTFGIGEVQDRVVVRDGKICVRPMMSLSLFFDHIVIDGAPAAAFLCDVRTVLENGLAEKKVCNERAASIKNIGKSKERRSSPSAA